MYLIRHAHAGSRAAWDGDDRRRPLSPKGRRQAAQVAELLDGHRIDRVVSSPATRCVETIEPLAKPRGLTVECDPRLGEGSEVQGCLDVMRATDGGLALCSHGDLIPKVVRRLRAEGMATTEGNISQKGSIWVLDVVDGQVVRGEYLAPVPV